MHALVWPALSPLSHRRSPALSANYHTLLCGSPRFRVLRYSHAYYITDDIKPLELPGKDRQVSLHLQSWFTDADAERSKAALEPLTGSEQGKLAKLAMSGAVDH